VACVDCHHEAAPGAGRDRQFRFATLHCVECHKDPHGGEFPATLKASVGPSGEICEQCHVLQTWRELKPFDHATAGFLLIGAHRTLACVDCHRPKVEPQLRRVAFLGAPEKCAGCHEDIHAGQFQRGNIVADCSTCHGSAHWAATVFDHSRTAFSLLGAHERTPCRLCHTQTREINGRVVVTYRGTPKECVDCHKR
jgi:predicted CXXCH cytochrome family protein